MSKPISLLKIFKDSVEKMPDHWSYSSWSSYHKCAFQYYCTKILNIKEPPSDNRALIRGIELHKKQEGYFKGDVTSLPREFKPFLSHYKAVKRLNPVVEKFWGVSEDWVPMNWHSWVVMKMDAAIIPRSSNQMMLWIQDLKSGREYVDAHAKQADLYVAIGSALFPKFKTAVAEFWYIDQGYPIEYEYTKRMVIELRKFWIDQGRKLLKRKKEYLPNPSEDNCKWCFLSAAKGGPCKQYWKPRGGY